MNTFIAVFVVMVLFVLFMAVGVIFARKPITGSCGGMAAVGMESACDVCGGDKKKCDTEVKKAKQEAAAGPDLGYNADDK